MPDVTLRRDIEKGAEIMADMDWGVYLDNKRVSSFISREAAKYYARSYNVKYQTSRFEAREMRLLTDEVYKYEEESE